MTVRKSPPCKYQQKELKRELRSGELAINGSEVKGVVFFAFYFLFYFILDLKSILFIQVLCCESLFFANNRSARKKNITEGAKQRTYLLANQLGKDLK